MKPLTIKQLLSISFFLFFLILSCTKNNIKTIADDPLDVDPDEIEQDYVLSEIKIDNQLYKKFFYNDSKLLDKLETYMNNNLYSTHQYTYDNQKKLTGISFDNTSIELKYANNLLNLIEVKINDEMYKNCPVKYEDNKIILECSMENSTEKITYHYNEDKNVSKIEYYGSTLSWSKDILDYDFQKNYAYAPTGLDDLLTNTPNNILQVRINSLFPQLSRVYNYVYTYSNELVTEKKVYSNESELMETWNYTYTLV